MNIKLKTIIPILLLAAFTFVIPAYAAITFSSAYDTDNIPETNPTSIIPVPSYQLDATQVFVATFAAQSDPQRQGQIATLTIYNLSSSYNFESLVEVDGQIYFTISLPYSQQGYSYNISVGIDTTPTRQFSVSPTPAARYDGVKVYWADAQDNITISSFPYTLSATVDSAYSQINSARLGLSSEDAVVEIPAEIQSNTLTFNLDNLPDGTYNAIIMVDAGSSQITSDLKIISLATGLEKIEPQGLMNMYVRTTEEGQATVVYNSIERQTVESGINETIELIDLFLDPLLEVYSFKITSTLEREAVYTFNAYNNSDEIIYSQQKTLSLKANTAEELIFTLPKADRTQLPEDVASVELVGSVIKWKQGKGLQVFNITVPNAVYFDLGAVGSVGIIPPVGIGGTIGTQLVINFRSKEISLFEYSGGGVGGSALPVPISLSAHLTPGVMFNLEQNKDLEDWALQVSGEVALGNVGGNMEGFVQLEKEPGSLLPEFKKDGYYGGGAGYSIGLAMGVDVLGIKSKLVKNWSLKDLLAHPVKTIKEIMSTIESFRLGDPGADYPDEFNGVASEIALADYDWSGYASLAVGKDKLNLLSYITYKQLLSEKAAYLKTTPSSDTGYVAELDYKILNLYRELEVNKYSIWNSLTGIEDIMILSNGYYEETTSLVNNKLNHPVAIVDVNSPFSSDHPILIIPSGGLYGLDNSEIFKAKLAEYVSQGGTLIVFSQQHGYEFNALPGGEVSGYGWLEDQACHQGAAYIDTYHQILSGQIKAVPDFSIDGYFTTYPENTTVLLRRTVNGQPAMIMYAYGQGRVIATAMYEDWAYGHAQSTSQGRALVRDMISWAKTAEELPEYGPGDTVSHQLPVTSLASNAEDATQIKVYILDPDRNIVDTQLINLPGFLSPGESAQITINYSLTTNDSLGVWWLDYELLDADGATIQPQTEGEAFVVSDPQLVPQEKEFNFWITSDAEQYAYGSDGVFTVHIKNNTDQSRNIRSVGYGASSAGLEQTLFVGAGSENSFSYVAESLKTFRWGFTVTFYDASTNEKLGMAQKGFRLYSPQVKIRVSTDKELYAKSDAVQIDLDLKSLNRNDLEITSKLRILDPDNTKVYEDIQEVTLLTNTTRNIPLSFALSQDLPFGNYLVTAEILLNNDKIGSTAVYFTLPKLILTMTPALPQSFNFDSVNPVFFTINNSGILDATAARLQVTLKNPSDSLIFDQAQDFDLAAGSEAALSSDIPLGPPLFGNYRLVYQLVYENEVIQGNHDIVNSNLIKLSLPKTSYKAGDDLLLSPEIVNIGKFNQNLPVKVEIPDFNYIQSQSITLSPEQAESLAFSTVIPLTAQAGNHTVVITLGETDTLTKSFEFFIPDSKLDIIIPPQENYNAGDNFTFNLTNSGGVTTDYSTTVKIIDSRGEEIQNNNLNGSILAAETKILSVILNSQAGNGLYHVFITAEDLSRNTTTFAQEQLTLSGLAADIRLITDKQSYLVNESVNSTTSITNLNMAIQDASLKLAVYPAIPTGTLYGIVLDSYTFTPISGAEVKAGTASAFTNSDGKYKLTAVSLEEQELEVNKPGYNKYILPISLTEGLNTFDIQLNTSEYGSLSGSISFVQTGEPIIDAEIVLRPDNIASSDAQERRRYSDTSGDYTLDFLPVGEYTLSVNRSSYQPYTETISITWGNNLEDIVLSSGSGPLFPVQPEDEFEPNDSFSQARVISLNKRFYPLMNSSSDEDYFKFSLNDPGQLQISISGLTGFSRGPFKPGLRLAAIGGFPPLLYLYDSSQTEVASNFGFALNATLTTTGQYYLRIQNNSPFTDRDVYELGIEFTPDIVYTPEPGALFEQIISSLNLSSEEALSIPQIIPGLGVTGKFLLTGRLFNNLNQFITGDKVNFYVQEGALSLILTTDKDIYASGETVYIIAEVKTDSTVLAGTRQITIFKDDQPFFTEEFYLEPDSAHNFTAETVISQPFKLSAAVDSPYITVEDYVEVAAPALEVTVTAPEVAGRGAFDIEVLLENSGNVPLSEQITISAEQKDINIPVGESRLVKFTEQISADTTFIIEITGDIVRTFRKSVTFGEDAALTLNIDALYPEGNIEITYTTANTGRLDTEFETTFTLNSASQKKTQFIPQGESITGSLYYNLTEGSYTLSYTTPFESNSLSFKVAKQNQLNLDLTLGALSYGELAVTILLENTGYNDISGRLLLDTGFWNQEQDLEILTGASQNYVFRIDTRTAQKESNSLKVSVVSQAGSIIKESTQIFQIPAAEFIVLSQTISPSYIIGESGTISFIVKNSGGVAAAAELDLNIYDLWQKLNSEWLLPQEEKEFTFNLIIPEGLEEKSYYAEYSLNGDKGYFSINVAGINIGVAASLDKDYYQEGDTAVLSLTITNRNLTYTPDMFARVQYNGFEDKQSFPLPGNQTLTFDIPLATINGKIFYGIYTQSGRSIYLNSIYVYRAGDVITLWTDKQVYDPGEIVRINISASETGTLNLNAPNYQDTIDISGDTTLSFTLPANMKAGTYAINYTFTRQSGGEQISGTHNFDLSGISLKVLDCRLDKDKYNPGDSITSTLIVETNQDLQSVLKSWIVDPEGNYTQTNAETVNLIEGESNLITLRSQLDSQYSGIHRLAYGLYGSGDLLLVSGSEIFDVGDAALLGVQTDKDDYPMGTEAVTVTVSLYGNAAAVLELEINGDVVETEDIVLDGFQTKEIEIPGLNLNGWLTLTTRLFWGNLSSSKTASFGYGYVSPPAGLSAIVKDGALDLSWTASPDNDVAGYKISYGQTPGDYYSPIDVGNLTSYELTGLTNGLTYYVVAIAYDNWNNESNFSNEVSGTPIRVGEFIPATVDIKPDTLNLRSQGKWVTGYIELPAERDVNDIDISTIRLNATISAKSSGVKVGDFDQDNISDLKVKFKRQELISLLEPGDNVTLIVSGELIDGAKFRGSDDIKVIDKGKHKRDKKHKGGKEHSSDNHDSKHKKHKHKKSKH